MHLLKTIAIAASLAIVPLSSAHALQCSNDGKNFNKWKKQFAKEYGSQFKKSTMKKFAKMQYDTKVIKSDRRNKAKFKGTFESFYKRRSKGVAPAARKRWKKYKKYFNRAEKQFGVQPEVILSIWGLETAFGRYSGNHIILQSTATLAYDCRRSESLFFNELLAALTIMDRGMGDLSKLKGAVHGEIGGTQFLPSRFLAAATDYDGKGVNVFKSAPDVIGSTAKWFAIKGWKRGGDYSPGSSNYKIIMEWNRADNYQLTIPKLAKAIARKK